MSQQQRQTEKNVLKPARTGRITLTSVTFFVVIAMFSDQMLRADEFADWVSEKHGQVEVRDGVAEAVDLSHCWITDADLDLLATQPRLLSINLSYTKISDQGLERLKPLTDVRHLDLRYAENVTDLGVTYVKSWPLEYLDLCGTKVSSSVFESAAEIKTLTYLDVGFSRVNDDYFELLVALENLKTLRIGGNKMSGIGLLLLWQLPSLRHLDVSGEQRTDSGLWSVGVNNFNIDSIAQIENLLSLDLGNTNLSDRGIAKLSSLKKLESLDLSGTECNADGLAVLRSFGQIKRLTLRDCTELGSDAIDELLNCKSLQVLDLTGTGFLFDDLLRLSELPYLQQLHIAKLPLTEQQVGKLRAELSGCQISWWKDVEVAQVE